MLEGLFLRYNTLRDFVFKHGDLLTYATNASAMTHEGKFSFDYIDMETEGELSLSTVTKKDDHKQLVLIFTQPETHITLQLKYIHPDIRDLFQRECAHLGWTE